MPRYLRPQAAFAQSQEEFDASCNLLRSRLQDQDFLANRGLGNEVGFHILCYDPARELQLRNYLQALVSDADAGRLPCHLIHKNLYDTMIQLCADKRILDRIPALEQRRGSAALLKQLARTASPEAFAQALNWEPHQPGDVLLLSGVGEVYPVLRVHALLDNMHVGFSDVPVVVAYPGRFNGQGFSLFGRLDDGHYYRAFEL